jgi:hypothetical protein
LRERASPYFKDPAFKDERKWRLVVKYRSGEYSLIPYIVLPVALKAELTLSEVVVGPTPLPENARAAAMQLLRPKPERSRTPISAPADRKIDCEKIVNSKIPFRRV